VFDPSNILHTLYQDICYEISREAALTYRGSANVILPSDFVRMIEGEMQKLFRDAIRSRFTKIAAEIHRHMIKRFQDMWCKIQTNDTCLLCLQRRPQYSLACGHCICENCVLIFGESSLQDPWLFRFELCFLCGVPTPNTNIRVHPPTAGASVLCIDGGGVRGVLPLKFLKLLQDRIDLPMPVQQFFNVVFGVSSGKDLRI
jgi:hypothetical protein